MTEGELTIFYHAKLENAHKMAQRYYADINLYAKIRDDIRKYEGKLKELDLIRVQRENVLGFVAYAESHLASSKEGMVVVSESAEGVATVTKPDCGALECDGKGNCSCAELAAQSGRV